MGRRDNFRRERVLRRKFTLTLFLCCILFAAGICIVDYSTNVLIYNRNEIRVAGILNHKTYLEFILFNKRLYINTSYLNRDMEKLIKLIENIF